MRDQELLTVPGPRAAGTKSLSRKPGVSNTTLLSWLIAGLLAVGLIAVLTASQVSSVVTYGSTWSIFLHQGLWVLLGLFVMIGVAHVPYPLWRKLRVLLPLVAGMCLLAVLLPHIGHHAYGSSRWLGTGSLEFQPSELAKLALLVFAADLVARRQEKGAPEKQILVPVLGLFALFALLLLAQPDMGTAIVVGAIALGVLFASGMPLKTLGKILGSLGAISVLAALVDPYRRERLLSFVNPWAHRSGSGYQVVQSLMTVGSGGLAGTGIGAAPAVWGLLPNAHTDFVFAVLAQEGGLAAGLLVLLLLSGVCICAVRVAREAPDRFGMLMAAGIAWWIAVQSIVNIGGVVGVLPLTGIPLPFISFGGSSLVSTMCAMGILMSISRTARRVGDTNAQVRR
jgi:cell division protein FtsW